MAWKTSASRALIICFSLGALAACSTLSEGECKLADWQAMGEEAGANGKNPDHLASVRKDCAEFGIAPDSAKYEKGYEEGLLSYCNERNGFARGEKGVSYKGMCPSHLEEEFLVGYEKGLILHGFTSEISAAETSISQKKNSIKALEKDIAKLEGKLTGDDTTAEKRNRINRDIKDKRKRRRSLAKEIQSLEIDIARLEGELTGLGY